MCSVKRKSEAMGRIGGVVLKRYGFDRQHLQLSNKMSSAINTTDVWLWMNFCWLAMKLIKKAKDRSNWMRRSRLARSGLSSLF